MDALTEKIDLFNEKYWIFVLFLLVGAGLYFCVRTVVVQLRYIPRRSQNRRLNWNLARRVFPRSRRLPFQLHLVWVLAMLRGWRWLSRRVVQVLRSGCGH